jgi:hypothetical protein
MTRVDYSKLPHPLRERAKRFGWSAEKVRKALVVEFANYWVGSVRATVELMIRDGYEENLLPDDSKFHKMVHTMEFAKALEHRTETEHWRYGLMTARECRKVLCEIARDPAEKTPDRSKAVELIAKMQGELTDKKQVKIDGQVSLASLWVEDDVEDELSIEDYEVDEDDV